MKGSQIAFTTYIYIYIYSYTKIMITITIIQRNIEYKPAMVLLGDVNFLLFRKHKYHLFIFDYCIMVQRLKSDNR